MNIEKLKEYLRNAESDLVENFEEYANYFDSEESLIEHLLDKDNSDELQEMRDSIADSNVSVYTYARFEWALHNIDAIQENEGEAEDSGAKSIEDKIAYCWYMQEQKDVEIDIKNLSEYVTSFNEIETENE